jgi:hypothetical protein
MFFFNHKNYQQLQGWCLDKRCSFLGNADNVHDMLVEMLQWSYFVSRWKIYEMFVLLDDEIKTWNLL